ncbi:MAG: Ig-like domain-containing protein [Gemmatimonadota bacterium]
MRRHWHSGVWITLFALIACGDDGTGPDRPGEPASVTLSTETVHLAAIGAAYPLTATVSDASGIALGNAAVSWSSDDETVATVDGSGVVEAVGVGEAEVTATAGGASASATVTVTQTAASVSVSPSFQELHAIGDTVELGATVRDANGHAIPDAAVAWSSADTAVAVVDAAAGAVVSRANGVTAIAAAVGDVSDEATVAVEQVAASVAISPSAPRLGEGETAALSVTVEDANGATIEGADVAWSSGDPWFATVDADGLVTARHEGVVRIEARADGAAGAADVDVMGKLLFVSDRTGTSQIYVANEDASGALQLTDGPDLAWQAEWSPDGSRIAFQRGGSVWIMNADGTGEVRLTDLSAADLQPTWSPDGTRIAFRSNRIGTGGYGILTINTDGTAMDTVTSPAASDVAPAWAPAGRIAFASQRDGDNEIYTVNPDGTDLIQITTNDSWEHSPAWSPDGSRIAFHGDATDDFDIYVMGADGSDIVNLTNNIDWNDEEPSWSPDGSRIYFVSDRDGNPELYVMNADGTDVTRLTDDPADDINVRRRPAPVR